MLKPATRSASLEIPESPYSRSIFSKFTFGPLVLFIDFWPKKTLAIDFLQVKIGLCPQLLTVMDITKQITVIHHKDSIIKSPLSQLGPAFPFKGIFILSWIEITEGKISTQCLWWRRGIWDINIRLFPFFLSWIEITEGKISTQCLWWRRGIWDINIRLSSV